MQGLRGLGALQHQRATRTVHNALPHFYVAHLGHHCFLELLTTETGFHCHDQQQVNWGVTCDV